MKDTHNYSKEQAYDKVKAMMHAIDGDAETVRNVLQVFDPEDPEISAYNYHTLIAATYEVEEK